MEGTLTHQNRTMGCMVGLKYGSLREKHAQKALALVFEIMKVLFFEFMKE